ncbi:hypothetical protein SO694_00025272 [Aureococcus anophagefferens]|uniref:CSD domain-containing protein n=1 Tax=Aureococcus anophagefferens TaxID=44056 RepID=A0ABR1FV50_AURAN
MIQAEPSAYGSFDSATQGGVILDGGGPLPRNSKALVVDAARISGRVLWFDARKNYGAIQPDRPLPGCDGGDGARAVRFRPPGARAAPPARLLGRVKWFDVERKQYGFLAPADHGPDLFVHAGDVVGCARRLAPGDAVEFAYGIQAQSGRPKALDVVRLVPAADGPEDGDGRGALGAFAAGDEPLFDGRRLAGVVVRFDAQHRWGFIRPDDPACQPEAGGENFFLHGLDVLDGGGPVVAGQAVEFAVVRSAARRCKAVHCVRLEPPPPGYGDESDASGSDGAPPLPY